MKQHTDWTEHLRERLDDATLTPATEGWKRIDEALRRTAPAPRRRPLGALLLPYRLPLAAALLVGALLTGFYLHTPRDPEPAPLLATAEPPVATATPTAAETSDRPATPLPSERDSRTRTPRQRTKHPQPAPETIVERQPNAPAAGPTAATDPQHARRPEARSAAKPSGQTAKSSEHAAKPSGHAAEARRAYAEALRPYIPPTRNVSRGRVSLGLFGGGSPVATGSPHNVSPAFLLQDALSSMAFATDNNDLAARRRSEYAQSEFDHRRPWSVGLTLRKVFGHGLSLETGLVYTQLKSEVRTHGSTIDQQLHFLGVPLRLDWHFVDRPRGGLYIGAGGMLERCLRARLGDERATENGWQCSLAGVVGAEYRFSGFAALYAEPEWSCHLTETDLKTIRTDHPVTFTLRVGLRFTF